MPAPSRQESLLMNRELIDDILNSDIGVVKQASVAANKATRTQIREEGFQRAILPFEDITNADLDYSGDSELSGVWFELEPDSPAARSIPYDDTPNTAFYRAEKYVVFLSIITSEELTKNINELRTYKTDVRQIVNDNVLRDMHTAEDVAFLSEIDRLVGATQVNLNTSPSREIQNIAMGQAITRKSYKRAKSFLPDRKIPNGVWLMNQRTAQEFIGWDRTEMGGDKAQELVLDGLSALESFKMVGVPHIATIKNELVFNGYVYQFGPKDFMGHALRLQDIEVTIKKEYDIVRMRAQEQVGLSIGNTRSVQKLFFNSGDATAAAAAPW
jgi:hypothetical protein